MVDADDEFRRAYPNLHDELEGSEQCVVDGVRTSEEQAERAAARVPTVTDHVRRCETVEEAIEIVDYFEERGEVSEERASSLRSQLVSRGVRSFGERREPGEIERNGL
ncbi:MAG: hypothetical protein MAG715_00108 [Methanonatronarchaeales archaeon]|nr:hypothetical protein [Methanonatronarchaeales archaeon]